MTETFRTLICTIYQRDNLRWWALKMGLAKAQKSAEAMDCSWGSMFEEGSEADAK